MRRAPTVCIIAAMLLIPALTVRAATGFADSRFQQQWNDGEAVAPNFWGPLANAKNGQQELYKEAQGGQRLVQYFDKGRMELTNGGVTNGLLATDLVKGQIQVGDTAFQPQAPPSIPIAGDPDNPGPTYQHVNANAATLLAPTPSKVIVAPSTGEPITRALTASGTMTTFTGSPGDNSVYHATYDSATQHNVGSPFVQYRLGAGVATIGLAISEPFWSRLKVAGQQKDVLVQVFERRVLTFTPTNPPAFQVEMGNIGAHYYQWRYGGTTSSGGPCTEACVFVGNEGGQGLVDATICLSIASGSANPIAKTDATGHYAAKTPDLQGHQETIIYWPVKAGYAFTPKYSAFSSYGGNETLTRNFVATPASAAATDCGPQPFR